MRSAALFVLAGVLASAPVAAERPESEPRPNQAGEKQLPPLKVSVDRSKVDLVARRLEVKMSRTAGSVKIKVLAASGQELAEEEHSFQGKPAGSPLIVTWKPSSDEAVARIEVWGYDDDGYYAGIAIVPWSVKIPHEEVLFDTDKAEIKPSEKPKLEESYERITKAIAEHKELGTIKLYIAGHTDTVGQPGYNVGLSRKRARAIGTWFKKRGLKIQVFYEGFGESVPAKKTEDEVDEPMNRRADYILAIEPPTLKSGVAAAWKKI
jgi:outer membrane protein OmpA-like peptidoglycan-associated protein